MRGLAWAEVESLKVPVDDDWGKTWAEVHPIIQKKIHQQQNLGGGGGGQGFGMWLFCLYIGCFFVCVFFVLRKTLKSSKKRWFAYVSVMKGTNKKQSTTASHSFANRNRWTPTLSEFSQTLFGFCLCFVQKHLIQKHL